MWVDDLKKSMSRIEIATPVIKKLLNGGEIKAIEGSDNEICLILDRTCGADYMHVYDDKGIAWMVASRIQTCSCNPYNTFTVRKARDNGTQTEYEKRKFAIKHGGVYPYLTMQAYFTPDDELLSLAIAKTTDIMDFVENGWAYERHTGYDQIGQASFFVVDWEKLAKKCKVLIYEKPSDDNLKALG